MVPITRRSKRTGYGNRLRPSLLLAVAVWLTLALSTSGGMEAWPELREAKGEAFISECRSLLEPMKAPPPYVFLEPNGILLERLPTLTPEERSAALGALAHTAVSATGDDLRKLEAVWRRTPTDGRLEIVGALVAATASMENLRLRAERLAKGPIAHPIESFRPETLLGGYNAADTRRIAGYVLAFILESDLSSYSTSDLRHLGRLVTYGWLDDAQRRALERHLTSAIRDGKVHPIAMLDAVRCVEVLGTKEAEMLLMIRALAGRGVVTNAGPNSTDRTKAVRQLASGHPSQGAINLFVLLTAEPRPGAAREAQRALSLSTDKQQAMASDSLFLRLFRGDPEAFRKYGPLLPSADERGLRRIGGWYFGTQSRADAEGLTERLRQAGVSLSEEEIRDLKYYEVADSVFEGLAEPHADEKADDGPPEEDAAPPDEQERAQ